MTKIAYNACFGGFSLSYDAVMEYARRKGFKLYAGGHARGKDGHIAMDAPYVPVSRDEAQKSMFYSFFKTPDFDWDNSFNARDIPRDDPDLIAIIEEMGDAANGPCARLAIEDVPSGSLYRIDEYDGNESVMTQNSYEWKTA